MPRLIKYIEIGICSGYQDGDFAVSAKVADLDKKTWDEIKLATLSAIRCGEDMRREMRKSRNPPSKAS